MYKMTLAGILSVVFLFSLCYGLNLNKQTNNVAISKTINFSKSASTALLSLGIFLAPSSTLLTSSLPMLGESFRVNAAESVFVGKYSDPFHPNCLRKIEESKNEIIITGSDDINAAKLWVIKAKPISPNEILVDFSPKGGPPNLLGKYNAKMNAIQWPDGNAWTKTK